VIFTKKNTSKNRLQTPHDTLLNHDGANIAGAILTSGSIES